MSLDEHYAQREIIGLIEPIVLIKSKRKHKVVKARIDTGATKSSIDEDLAKELNLGPVLGETVVTNANGSGKREFLEVTFAIAGKTMTEVFTLANRSRLRYPVLIGRNVLKRGFLVDPNKQTRTIPKEQAKLRGFM